MSISDSESTSATADPTQTSDRAPARVLAGSAIAVAISAVWVVLAFANPGTNYHFAPLVVTMTPTFVARFGSSTTLSWSTTALSIVGGLVAATLGALMLLALVAFDGPTLATWLTPESEAIIMTAIGVGASMLIGRAGRRPAP